MNVATIEDVTASQNCCGCGACTYICPDLLRMEDDPEQGLRPIRISNGASTTREAVAVCPGIHLEHDFDERQAELIGELSSAWGPVLGIWEGYATDDEIRFAGSSGGAATAIALYCIEAGDMHGVLHTAARSDVPYLNTTTLSRTRQALLAATGSRYAPASPCDGLQEVADAPGPCVFIGKPCDVAAAQKARKLRPELDAKLGVCIGFFCAGTPSTQGTLAMLKHMGVDNPEDLVSLRYRGNGWPGKATAVFRRSDGTETSSELSYEDSWGEILTNHKQWRCKVCADHTGEFADIAVGDPWYRPVGEGDPGQSLILARTARGRAIIEAAAAAGYVKIAPVEPRILPASQMNLLKTRGAVWGRILACRLAGKTAPRYFRMPMFRHWWRELTIMEKTRSIGGTWKRLVKRGAARNAS